MASGFKLLVVVSVNYFPVALSLVPVEVDRNSRYGKNNRFNPKMMRANESVS